MNLFEDEHCEPYRKKKKVKKTFFIEYRVDTSNLPFFKRGREWHRWKGYKTEKAMETALQTLQNNSMYKWLGYEFKRAVD